MKAMKMTKAVQMIIQQFQIIWTCDILKSQRKLEAATTYI